MVSVTGWTRLEPLPRTDDLAVALEARIADPLWLLARQRQMGEFLGEDGGSPISVQLRAESARISRFHPGAPPTTGADAGAMDYDDQSLPLEVLVERETVRTAGQNLRLAAQAGLHFLRLLDHHGAGGHKTAYRDVYRFPADAPAGLDRDGQDWYALVALRALDGFALQADFEAHRGEDPALTSLPAQPDIPGNVDQVIAAANDWRAWFAGFVTEPPAGGPGTGAGNRSWNASRLEYQFAAAVQLSRGPAVLHADEYSEGDLDWYSFRVAASPDLGEASPPVPPEAITRTVIPTPVSYSGQPSDRFWGFEDGTVSFGNLSAAPGDLARLIMVEFALVYGNDWFVVPIDLPVGSVCAVQSMEVVDTFGEVTMVEPARDVGGRQWSMYRVTGPEEPGYLTRLFLLPPTLPKPMYGDAVEQVAMFRDEMANMVWGVERKVQNATGRSVDRYEERQQALASGAHLRIDGDIGDAELVYRLMSEVPEHWIPFVPVPLPQSGAGSFAIQLERRAMLRVRPSGTETIEPKGLLLEPGQPLRVEEEEISSAGIVLERAYQHTRWVDGHAHLWMGRRKRAGRGEGASGLRFDLADQPRR
jgi:hypothetical protein